MKPETSRGKIAVAPLEKRAVVSGALWQLTGSVKPRCIFSTSSQTQAGAHGKRRPRHDELRKNALLRWRLIPAILAVALAVPFARVSNPVLAKDNGGVRARAAAQSTETRLASGKALYGSACVFCHGVEGKGASAGPALSGRFLAPKTVAEIIANGKTGTAMPAFKGRYSQSQIDDLVAYILSLSSSSGSGAATPAKLGETIYASKCASCHEAGNPPFFNHLMLKTMSPDYILYQLKSGPMRLIAARLTIGQRVSVSEYLTGKRAGSSRPRHPSAGRCSGPAPQDFSGPEWNGWGIDYDNSRFQPANQAGLTASQVPSLQLKWAFGFPGDLGAFAQPVVVGGRVFFGSPMGAVYALDAKTGLYLLEVSGERGRAQRDHDRPRQSRPTSVIFARTSTRSTP